MPCAIRGETCLISRKEVSHTAAVCGTALCGCAEAHAGLFAACVVRTHLLQKHEEFPHGARTAGMARLVLTVQARRADETSRGGETRPEMHKTTGTSVRMALAVALYMIAADTRAAAQDITELTLEQLMRMPVVTASRHSEPLTDAPARMHVVTADQIRARGYRSLVDVLDDLADFKVDIGGDQDYPIELTVQGSRGANRVIVLLDGMRVSSPTNEPLPVLANYPVHAARQIEILYGPASAVYGADAFSAIVNIITRDAPNDPRLELETSAGQHGLTNHMGSLAVSVGRGSLVLAGQVLSDAQPDLSRFYPADFKGLEGQRTGTFNTIFGPMSAVGHVSPEYDVPLSAHSFHGVFRLGGLQVSVFENGARMPTTPAYTPDNAVYNDAAFNRNSLLVGSGAYTRQVGPVTSTSTLTASRHELDPESGYWNVYSNMKKSYKYAYGSMLKVDQQVTWKPAAASTLIAGATYERFFAIPQGADLNAPVTSHDVPGTILDTGITDGFIQLRYANGGAYAQLQQSISRRLTATIGARADYNTRYGATFNPRLGLVARAAPATTIKLLFGTAYLAPSPYQSYGHYGSFYSNDEGRTYQSEYWHVPNPNLKPQRKKAFEVNLIQGLGESVVLSASTFYAQVTDRIQESDPDTAGPGQYLGWPVGYIDFAVNEGDDTTYGGTLGVDLARPLGADGRIDVRAAVTVTDGHVSREDADGSGTRLPIGGMAPVQLKLGADVRHGLWSAAPRLTLSGAQRLRATETIGGAEARRTLDGYATLDVHLRRRNIYRALDAFVTVENALDARYRHINMRAYSNPEELIGAPQNPRRITVGLQVQLP